MSNLARPVSCVRSRPMFSCGQQSGVSPPGLCWSYHSAWTLLHQVLGFPLVSMQ